MRSSVVPAVSALVLLLGVSACSDPNDPGQRALAGGAIGAGAGAAIGGAAAGWHGAAIGALAGGALGAITGAVTTPHAAPASYRSSPPPPAYSNRSQGYSSPQY